MHPAATANTRFIARIVIVASLSLPPWLGSSSEVRRLAVPYQRQELVARLLVGTKSAKHCARHCHGTLFLHAPHHHTHVTGLNNDSDAPRLQLFFESPRDLAREALLNLQPASVDIHKASNL